MCVCVSFVSVFVFVLLLYECFRFSLRIKKKYDVACVHVYTKYVCVSLAQRIVYGFPVCLLVNYHIFVYVNMLFIFIY